MEYPSDEDEEYEGEQEADDPQGGEQRDDDPQEGEEEDDDPQEDEMPDDDGFPAHSLVHSAHSVEPDSPIHQLEPVSPDNLFLFDSPPGSPVASDMPFEISSESADLSETGRIWAQLTSQGERISQLVDRLERVITEFIGELRVDMATVVGRTTAIRRGMMEVHEQMESLQRGFLTAREADRKLWQRNIELEKEVADLKRDKYT